MNIYHVIVLAIIGVAMAFAAYRFPHRGWWFRLLVSLTVAVILVGMLIVGMGLYDQAVGQP